MTADTDREARLEEIRERWNLAPDGPWILATSNSWRRILRESGEAVCVPITQRRDGHPDLLLPNHSGEAIANAPEDIYWLLSEIDRLREIEEAASEVLRHEDTASDHGPGDGVFIDSYRAAFNHLRQALHEGDEDG